MHLGKKHFSIVILITLQQKSSCILDIKYVLYIDNVRFVYTERDYYLYPLCSDVGSSVQMVNIAWPRVKYQQPIRNRYQYLRIKSTNRIGTCKNVDQLLLSDYWNWKQEVCKNQSGKVLPFYWPMNRKYSNFLANEKECCIDVQSDSQSGPGTCLEFGGVWVTSVPRRTAGQTGSNRWVHPASQCIRRTSTTGNWACECAVYMRAHLEVPVTNYWVETSYEKLILSGKISVSWEVRNCKHKRYAKTNPKKDHQSRTIQKRDITFIFSGHVYVYSHSPFFFPSILVPIFIPFSVLFSPSFSRSVLSWKPLLFLLISAFFLCVDAYVHISIACFSFH